MYLSFKILYCFCEALDSTVKSIESSQCSLSETWESVESSQCSLKPSKRALDTLNIIADSSGSSSEMTFTSRRLSWRGPDTLY